jgi:tRNA (guanine-N7-)-methyltransferase
VGKGKHKKFEETKTFPNFFQPTLEEVIKDIPQKGNWHKDVFKNDHPIVLEVGCGKAEYTTGLAEKTPGKNFIGIDIKGARLWRGGKTMLEKGLQNVAFVRTRIEYIDHIFDTNEIDEIWITFPDPQPKKERNRLTHPRFLKMYRSFSKPGVIVHLKTDSQELHEYTKEVIDNLKLPLLKISSDIYRDNLPGPLTEIQTHYEKLFSKKGKLITYLQFRLP